MHRALRLTLDRSALHSNWRWLRDRSGVEAGAAVKADGYGLGVDEVSLRSRRVAAPTSSRLASARLDAVPSGCECCFTGSGEDVERLWRPRRAVLNTVEQWRVAEMRRAAPATLIAPG